MQPILSRAATDVITERQRQISNEGFTARHDDRLRDGELVKAAASYALGSYSRIYDEDLARPCWQPSYLLHVNRLWPFAWSFWKPRNRRRDLVRATALLLAEIERLDRAAGQADR